MTGYAKLRGLGDVEVPDKEGLILILQHHDLYYRKDMGREELWEIWATYYNARDELISILRDESMDQRRKELLHIMEQKKNA